MATEIWRDIEGYDGKYQVSNLGRVKSFKRKTPHILKPNVVRCGYLVVALYCDKKIYYTSVHRLVAETFISNPFNKPQVNHINGDKSDNRVDNLEWCTAAENIHHAYALGLRSERNPRAKLTDEQVAFVRENPDGLNGVKLAVKFGVGKTTISAIQRGEVYKNASGRIRTEKLPSSQRVPNEVRAEIRSLYVKGSQEFGAVALAKKYGVGHKTIWRIVHET